MRVRDLPIAGQPTRLVLAQAPLPLQRCGRTFTETHEQLPAVSASPRASGRGCSSA